VFEDQFLRFLDDHGLPRPEVNTMVGGYEGDMLWRAQRLIAELDGRQHERAFEDDRERDAHLLAHGLSTIRITWRRLTTEEGREARRIRHLLAQRD
jgi:very-short-patch-repair endonuclease